MKRYLIPLVFLLILFSPGVYSQFCTTTHFGKAFTFPGFGRSHFSDLMSGGQVMSGTIRNYKTMLTLADSDGNLQWAKTVDYAESVMYSEIADAKRDLNNNIFFSNNGPAIGLMDINGNLLALKELKLQWGNVYVLALGVLPDNSKIVLVDDETTYGGDGYMLLRLSADLSSILWCKHFSAWSTYFNSMTVNQNRIYICGRKYESGMLLDFDDSGNLLHKKEFRFDNKLTVLHNVYPYPGGYIVKAYYNEYLYPHVIMRLDTNFNVLNTYRFLNVTDNVKFALATTAQGDFYGIASSGLSAANRFYVTRNDSMLWNRWTFGSWTMAPYKLFITAQGLVSAGMSNWNNVGVGPECGIDIARSDFNGSIPNCYSEPATFTRAGINYTSGTADINPRDTSTISLQNVTPIITDVTLLTRTGCNEPSMCNSIFISGLTSYCSDTVTTYTARRNPGCRTPVEWELLGGNAITQTIRDSLFSVKFLQPGSYTLIAKLGGCTTLSDTIRIQVSLPGEPLNIGGPDTVLCQGNTIRLNASNRFQSYRWQNGSTDSLLNVTLPGLYYVQVTDACNNIQSDTIRVSPAATIPLSIGPDRTICLNDSVHLNAPGDFINYNWGPNYQLTNITNQQVVVRPQVDTIYHIRAEKTPGCFGYDTVRIRVNPLIPITLGVDRSLCFGDSLVLNAGTGFSQYNWSNGSGSQVITVNLAGSYSIVATAFNGCKSYDTLTIPQVWSKMSTQLNKDSVLCAGTTRVLQPGIFNSYLWQDGSTSPTYPVNSAGIYFVKITDTNSCSITDTVHISKIAPPPSNFLSGDSSICNYGVSQLKTLIPFKNYSWNTGSTGSSINISQPGIYWLRVTDNNRCIGTDSILVTIKECMKGLFVPSGFTPNNDGRNDVMRPFYGGRLAKFEFTVYNRWGEIIFRTNQLGKGWDGKVKNLVQDGNVFIWTCNYQPEDDKPKFERGTFVLIR